MPSSAPSAAGSLVITRAISRKMARPEQQADAVGPEEHGGADGDDGEDGQPDERRRDHLVRVGCSPELISLQQPVLAWPGG